MTPLQAAVNRNDLRCFELCRRRDILNVRNREGKTALILAAEQGNAEIISALLKEDTKDLEIDAQDVCIFLSSVSCSINFLNSLLLDAWTDRTPCCCKALSH